MAVANIPLSATPAGRVTALLTRKEIVSIVSEWPAGLGACVMGTRSVVWPRQAGKRVCVCSCPAIHGISGVSR